MAAAKNASRIPMGFKRTHGWHQRAPETQHVCRTHTCENPCSGGSLSVNNRSVVGQVGIAWMSAVKETAADAEALELLLGKYHVCSHALRKGGECMRSRSTVNWSFVNMLSLFCLPGRPSDTWSVSASHWLHVWYIERCVHLGRRLWLCMGLTGIASHNVQMHLLSRLVSLVGTPRKGNITVGLERNDDSAAARIHDLSRLATLSLIRRRSTCRLDGSCV